MGVLFAAEIQLSVGRANKMGSIESQQVGEDAMAVQDRLKTLLLGTKTFRTVTKLKQLMPLQILILWILELMRFAVS